MKLLTKGGTVNSEEEEMLVSFQIKTLFSLLL